MDVSALSLSLTVLRMAESDRYPDVDLVVGPAQIIERMNGLAVSADTVIQSFNSTSPGTPSVCMNHHVRPGVLLQSVWGTNESDVDLHAPTHDVLAERRFGETPLPKMIIGDRRRALVAIPGVPTWDAAVALQRPERAAPYLSLFDATFRRAGRSRGPSALPTHIAQLLGHLRAGCTEAQAARRMGVTDRTIRRWMRDLHRLSGTATRFQLGEWSAGL